MYLKSLDIHGFKSFADKTRFEFAEGVNAEVGASIWNVLNKRNIVNRFYSRDANDPITQNDEFALRLTSNFSFRLKF